MKAKDERMKIPTQTFNIIKTIKLYSWENAFIAKIKEKREEEIALLRQTNSLHVTINGVYWSGTIILLYRLVFIISSEIQWTQRISLHQY